MPESGGLHHQTQGSLAPGSRAEFEVLVRQSAPVLFAYLRTLAHHTCEGCNVDDMFQETMLVAWRRFNDYDRLRPFGPWVRGIGYMVYLSSRRAARRNAGTHDPSDLDAMAMHLTDAEISGESAGLIERLRGCVELLPTPMREAVDAVYQRKLSISAAAAALAQNIETIGKRVQRARALLANCLGMQTQSIKGGQGV